MNNFAKILAGSLFLVLFFCIPQGQALETDFHGRVQSTFVLRDTSGFGDGIDDLYGVQWRNELKFDLTIRPEYEELPAVRVEKYFMTYRGYYDAIFDLTDRYDDVREKSPGDFEYGKDDLETENDLREAFVDIVAEGSAHSAVFRLGRQIVQWGEADGFNVVNILNPQDNKNMMFFETPEDLATPLWMARFNYSRGTLGFIRDFGVELVAIPDIRPHMFAPMDDTMDAPYAFGYKQLKGKDLEYFHKLSGDLGFTAMGIDLGTIDDLESTLPMFGITDSATKWEEDVPASGAANLEYGIKVQASFGDLATAFYYFRGYQDDPALDFSDLLGYQKLYLRHPKQNMFGVSFNYFCRPINAVIRGEGCLIDEMSLVDLTGVNGNAGALFTMLGMLPNPSFMPPGTSGSVGKKVYQGLIGLDKDIWMLWLNQQCMIHTSFQLFGKHINEWEYDSLYRPFDEDDSARVTMFVWTDYWHGRIHPELFVMYDPKGTWMTMASAKYTRNGRLFFKLTQMSFYGDADEISVFTQPVDLTRTSELSFRVEYNW